MKDAKTCYVLNYTRLPLEDAIYSEKLAYSMHLSVSMDGKCYHELNHNSGILYTKAIQNPEDGTLKAKSLKKPWLFEMKDGTYGVLAIRIETNGDEDDTSKGKLLYFTSKDLLKYEDHALIPMPTDDFIEDICCHYDQTKQAYKLQWREKAGTCYETEAGSLTDLNANSKKKVIEYLPIEPVETQIETAVGRNILEVPETIAQRLIYKLTVPENIRNEVPESVNVCSDNEIKQVKATAWYSDGSSVQKPVDWKLDQIDFNTPATYQITGRIHQDHYDFPISLNRADPCIGKWKGKYYFIATNDADNNHTLYIRESETISGLVTAPEALILDSNTYPHIGNLLWAPEFHVIKDRLYIFHAATPNEFGKEHSHVMELKENGNPMKASDWSMPLKVLRKDGSPLYEPGITLDMTEFEVNGRYFVMWSQRQFVPVDQGAWLYIAEINPDEPWKLISDPVLVSMPEYGWANNHTFVDEGPFALITDKKLFVTFSSAAVDSTYVVGLLCAELDADLLNPSSWVKLNYPILSSRSVVGEYGTGHNSYVQDEDGLIWNAYHGRPGVTAPRSSGIRRVHFDYEGYPILAMTEEKDLNSDLATVSMSVIVK